MLSIQRRNEIKLILFEKQNVTVSEMAEQFGVSLETIRRDFNALEKEGFLAKAYGGAVLKKHVKSEVAYQVLEGLFIENKQRIAKKSAEFVYSGDCIFVDYSTTVFQLLNEIIDYKLTVMTNSLKALTVLAEYNNIKVVATGGEYDSSNFSFSGRIAERYISHYHLDKAFISCRAISMEKGLSDRNEREADIHRSMIESANAVYLLVDHTKFDKDAFVHTCGFEKITAIITDHALSESWKSFLKERRISYYECI